MWFLGIDFGWTSQPSGVAALRFSDGALTVEHTALKTTAEEIPDWVRSVAGDAPAMVAIDAPTIIRNPTGMRPVERLMHHHFGRQHAGCYPSNLASPFAARTLALSRALEAMGIAHAPRIVPEVQGRYQIEVHPHAATLHLLGLQRILKYKKGRLAERRSGLAYFQTLLNERLSRQDLPLRWIQFSELPLSGRELKAAEDQTDAILAAYIGAWWWRWGTARNLVLGDAESGFIVVPVSAETAMMNRRAEPG